MVDRRRFLISSGVAVAGSALQACGARGPSQSVLPSQPASERADAREPHATVLTLTRQNSPYVLPEPGKLEYSFDAIDILSGGQLVVVGPLLLNVGTLRKRDS
ncbi:MAG TPA: hypothetical protein VMH02_05195 [Verrucomicrobiae bacterium]|nr:hypothetical protein [Verrucomicrobiae bacterium]